MADASLPDAPQITAVLADVDGTLVTKTKALTPRAIDAIADFLGTKPFFMGAEPTGADATMFAFAAGILCPLFETPLRAAAERHHNLKPYVGRMAARFYPDDPELAGRKAAA